MCPMVRSAAADDAITVAVMATATYEVSGMTCDHCVNAVKGELSQLDGVDDVEVQLDSGKVSVTSAEPLEADTVRAAVERAGYALRD